MNDTTTTAREGIQTLGTVDTGPMGWDAAEDMPDEGVARGMPVLWLLTEGDVTPPWGRIARMS